MANSSNELHKRLIAVPVQEVTSADQPASDESRDDRPSRRPPPHFAHLGS